jgi:hypothetical protein
MFKQVVTEACNKRKILVEFNKSTIYLAKSRFHNGQVNDDL